MKQEDSSRLRQVCSKYFLQVKHGALSARSQARVQYEELENVLSVPYRSLSLAHFIWGFPGNPWRKFLPLPGDVYSVVIKHSMIPEEGRNCPECRLDDDELVASSQPEY
ncbi:hypothetical protein RRG08_061256 [Elysia crispata]|uniref:Uncharacterized protein n=1 Tax=Elysia crispata TaxID=231223 RepID=A0AAE1DFN6_9GAST|nr:hypothetical protein RRG08_061256 [Elysia crispata]